VSRLREAVWSALLQGGEAEAAAALRRELLLGPSARWGPWSPPGGSDCARAELLRAETAAALATAWPDAAASVTDADVSSAEAASALAARLLSTPPKSTRAAKAALLSLGEAMVGPWRGGAVWGLPEDGLSGVHSAWANLLGALLSLPGGPGRHLPAFLPLLQRGAACCRLLLSEQGAAGAVAAIGSSQTAAAILALALPYEDLHDEALARLGQASGGVDSSLAAPLLALLLHHGGGALGCLRGSRAVWPAVLDALAAAPMTTAGTDADCDPAAGALLPCAVAELVAAGQPLVAGGLLLERGRVSPALRSPDAALAILQRYLRAAARATSPASTASANTAAPIGLSAVLPATAAVLLAEAPQRCSDALQTVVNCLK